MKRIDKTVSLAEKYFTWLDQITQKKTKHPKYVSSGFRYYYDIVANLIWIQNGICAYTERKLMDFALFEPNRWKDGVFESSFEFAGQLDHYDSSLKDYYGWSWDNFFVVDSDVNMKYKRTNIPLGILKPDLVDFDPYHLLEYDISSHFFIPNRNLEFTIQEQVKHDLSCLGLNFQPISDIRREYLSGYLNKLHFGQISVDNARGEIFQFFTAFEMALIKLAI